MSDNSNVSLSALPLKAYDFFSKIFPGVSVLLSAYFFEDLYVASQSTGQSPASCSLPVHWLLNEVWRNSGNASSQAAVAAISMCAIYLAGQLVSSVANFFLDRIFVYKCYGYPYEHQLLNDYKENIFADYFSRRFYRGSIFWLHAAAFLFVMYDIYNTRSTYLICAFVCVGVFLIALLIHLLIQYLNKKKWINGKVKRCIKKMADRYSSVYKLLMNPIQHINQTTKVIQPELAKKYRDYFKTDFKIDARDAESDNYWLTLFYVRKNDPRMSDLINRWYQSAIHQSTAVLCETVQTPCNIHL